MTANIAREVSMFRKTDRVSHIIWLVSIFVCPLATAQPTLTVWLGADEGSFQLGTNWTNASPQFDDSGIHDIIDEEDAGRIINMDRNVFYTNSANRAYDLQPKEGFTLALPGVLHTPNFPNGGTSDYSLRLTHGFLSESPRNAYQIKVGYNSYMMVGDPHSTPPLAANTAECSWEVAFGSASATNKVGPGKWYLRRGGRIDVGFPPFGGFPDGALDDCEDVSGDPTTCLGLIDSDVLALGTGIPGDNTWRIEGGSVFAIRAVNLDHWVVFDAPPNYPITAM